MQRAPAGPVRRALLVPVILLALMVAAPGPTLAAKSASRYLSLERFALSLLNCTRTGGWVRKNGVCVDRGSGKHSGRRRPLVLSAGISTRVSRPYAFQLARADACMHTLGSSIDGRFRKGGYKGARHGESVGCSGGYTTRQMVIRSHRLFQSEQAANGWHWKNLKNRDFRRVGIGIARVGRESRIVYDFYGA